VKHTQLGQHHHELFPADRRALAFVHKARLEQINTDTQLRTRLGLFASSVYDRKVVALKSDVSSNNSSSTS
jgi:hypothetical protein